MTLIVKALLWIGVPLAFGHAVDQAGDAAEKTGNAALKFAAAGAAVFLALNWKKLR